MPAYNGDEIHSGAYQNNYGKSNAVYSAGKTTDSIDEQGFEIAQKLSQKTGWNVVYGGAPVQHRHFIVSKGIRASFEYHPQMPRAKSMFDSNGWHIDSLQYKYSKRAIAHNFNYKQKKAMYYHVYTKNKENKWEYSASFDRRDEAIQHCNLLSSLRYQTEVHLVSKWICNPPQFL